VCSVPVDHREIGDRFAHIVQQSGDAGGQMPAWLEDSPLLRQTVEGKEPSATGAGGLEGDLEPVPQEPARAAMVMGFGGRQQMDEGGVALDQGEDQGAVVLITEGQGILKAGDECLLGREDLGCAGDGQAFEEGRIARDLRRGVKIGGRCRC